MRRICEILQYGCMLLNLPPEESISTPGQLFHSQALLLINVRLGHGRREEQWRNRRFKKERERREYCILLGMEERKGERKETGKGELLH